MATQPITKANPLQPEDWTAAGFARLGAEGVEAVRVEVLARDLGVSKGSFYWHFRDREDLLEKMLARWEDNELEWLSGAIADRHSAAARWARLVERSSDAGRMRAEAALRAWARTDTRIATRIRRVENRRAGYIATVLLDVGFTARAAESWSELAMLVYLGWLDRATRDPEFQLAGPGLGEFLSELVLAASGRTSTSNR